MAGLRGPAVPDDFGAHPAREAVSYLRRLHWRSRWMPPSELLATIVSDCRMLEVAATGAQARDVWRRLRFVVDQARAWSEAEHGGLRAYLAGAARQGDEAARVAEAVLPESDVDAVRIMTVHSAKGLEFGMVVMAGMTSAPRNRSGVEVIWPRDHAWEVKLNKLMQTNDFQAVQPLHEQMDRYERVRLLYAAATRGRDHLVVSLHRNAGGIRTNARVRADAGAGSWPDAAVAETPTQDGVRVSAPMLLPPPDFDQWETEMEAVRAATRRASVIRALPPWSKGRYGPAIGPAVHAVLQGIDLATDDGLDQAVSAQCVAEGVTEFAALVTSLVRSAVDSVVVTRAVPHQYWRESLVATQQADGIVLEGFIDLMFREDDGSIVVVDDKTDDVPAGGIGPRAMYYQPQIDAYCRAVAAASGATVRAVLLLLHPTRPAIEIESPH